MSNLTVFISDIHLSEHKPEINLVFNKFINWAKDEVKNLYLLGDIFDVWLGDDDDDPFIESIRQQLKQLNNQGTKIYLMRGNRDVMMGSKFADSIGATLLEDPTVINLFGNATLLMHGDTLCTKDIKYLKFRKKMHNPLIRFMLLNLPLSIRQKIAKKARSESKAHQAKQTEEIMDVTQEEVLRVMNKYKVKQLIHGHVHREAIHDLVIDNDQPDDDSNKYWN